MNKKFTLTHNNGRQYDNLAVHNPKVLKNPKGYDRVRDRKNQRLYDYEEDEIDDFEQEEQSVF